MLRGGGIVLEWGRSLGLTLPIDIVRKLKLREKQIKAWESRSMIEKLKFNKIARPRLRLGEAGEDPRPRR